MTISALTLLAAAALAVAMVAMAMRSPNAPGRHAFILAGLSSIWWVGAVILRLNAPDLQHKVFFAELAWLGIVATPLFWSAGFLRYANFARLDDASMLRRILMISLVALIAAFTNRWHHGIYTAILNTERPTFAHGWFYFMLLGFGYFAMALSCAVAIRLLRTVSSLHRWQLAGIMAAMALPWLANIAFVLFQFRIFNDDPTPFAFGLTALIMLLARMHGKLFTAPPVARDVIFTILPDPVIVVDEDWRILELNPAARELPDIQEQPIGKILPASSPLRQALSSTAFTESGNKTIRFDDEAKTYQLSYQPLAQWGRTGCQLLVLRDISAREAAREQLAAATGDLQLRLEENLRLQQRLREEAARDHLTGLYNRRHASLTVPSLLKNMAPGSETAVVLIDIDHFKRVNDRYGHNAGDEVLVAFSAILKETLNESEMAFRFGGEEFLVVLPGHGSRQAEKRCEEWRQHLRGIALPEAPEFTITFSAGIALATQTGRTLESCTNAADIALYQAKIAGRDRDVVWTRQLEKLSPKNLIEQQASDNARDNGSKVA